MQRISLKNVDYTEVKWILALGISSQYYSIKNYLIWNTTAQSDTLMESNPSWTRDDLLSLSRVKPFGSIPMLSDIPIEISNIILVDINKNFKL